jgi:hypothetical protein
MENQWGYMASGDLTGKKEVFTIQKVKNMLRIENTLGQIF